MLNMSRNEDQSESDSSNAKKKFKFSISYNRCCKPIPVEYKCSAKNLRTIPIDLVDKWNAKYACESSQESSQSNFLFIVLCCFICT